MRLLLQCPKFTDDSIPFGLPKDMEEGIWVHTPLALSILAALTPRDVDVRIVNENLKEIDFSNEVDLIGIHVMEYQAPRAREISRRYREKGVKVVMGGGLPDINSGRGDKGVRCNRSRGSGGCVE